MGIAFAFPSRCCQWADVTALSFLGASTRGVQTHSCRPSWSVLKRLPEHQPLLRRTLRSPEIHSRSLHSKQEVPWGWEQPALLPGRRVQPPLVLTRWFCGLDCRLRPASCVFQTLCLPRARRSVVAPAAGAPLAAWSFCTACPWAVPPAQPLRMTLPGRSVAWPKLTLPWRGASRLEPLVCTGGPLPS